MIGDYRRMSDLGNREERDPAPPGYKKPKDEGPSLVLSDPFPTMRFMQLYGIGPAEAALRGLDELDLGSERARRIAAKTWDESKKLSNYRGEK